MKMCLGLFLSLICTGSPVSMSAIKMKEDEWPLYIPRSIGTILGALFAGVALDRYGRRNLMIFSGLWVLFTIDWQPWLPPEIFFYLHGFSGFGYGMIFVIYIVYISETVCAKYRGLAISMNCAARTLSGSNVVLLYFSEFSVYYGLKVFIFIVLVFFALAGLKCIWLYSQETHVFRILKDRGNDDELQSNSNPIIDQEVGQEIEPSEQQIESHIKDTELLENDLLSKSTILMQHPFKVYLKSVLLILIFRLPLLTVQNYVFSLTIFEGVDFLHKNNIYHHLLLAIVSFILKVGHQSTFTRKFMVLSNIFIIALMFFAISGIMYFLVQDKKDMVGYYIYPMLLTQLVALTGLFIYSDLLLADFLPLKYRSLNVAIIFCIEHLLKLYIYFIALGITASTVFLFMSAIISAISGIVVYFKFDSLYGIYQ